MEMWRHASVSISLILLFKYKKVKEICWCASVPVCQCVDTGTSPQCYDLSMWRHACVEMWRHACVNISLILLFKYKKVMKMCWCGGVVVCRSVGTDVLVWR